VIGTVEARLASELTRIGTERDHDDVQMRTTIVDDNNGTAMGAESKIAALHTTMKAELNSMLHELTETFNLQKAKESADFQTLVARLSSWDASQKAENQRQRNLLQSVKDMSLQGAGIIGAQVRCKSACVSSLLDLILAVF
jgi:hypothetical protein